MTDYQIGDETIRVEDTEEWQVEFEPDKLEQVAALKALDIDADLCCIVDIVKSEDGRYFALWDERHPELGTFDEYFQSDGYEAGRSKRTTARVKKWAELWRRMPSKHYAEEISRDDAYRIIASFWLPEEFHAAAGL